MTRCLLRVWRIVLTALLALAVASAWSSGSMAARPPVSHLHAHAGAETGHAQMDADAHIASGHAHRPSAVQTDLANKSDPAGLACCVMTICHPAVPVLPIQIAHAPSNVPPALGPFLSPTGNGPSPALPPPRNSQM